MTWPPQAGYQHPQLMRPPTPPPRPREIGLVKGLLYTTMALCLCGDAAAIYSLTQELTTLGVVVTVVTTYFAIQSFATPAPLERGARRAWVWTLSSALAGLLSGVPAIATGLAWLEPRPYVLPIGLVWTILYATMFSALITRPVREWIFT